MSNRVLKIKELDPDMIAPSTKSHMNPSQGGSKIVIIGKPGCFIRGTKVLMYDGNTKNVEDVQVGDVVMGDDSTPRNVLELCHNTEPMYKIIPSKGEGYTVNESHKLVLSQNIRNDILEITVRDYLNRKDLDNYKIYKTGVIFNDNTFIKKIIEKYVPYNENLSEKENRKILLQLLALKQKTNDIEKDIFFIQNSIQEKTMYNFKVEPIGEDEYFGFTLDGNHRFLLGTFDVVRNTGKSTMITSLLYEKSHIFPSATIFSGTEDSNHHYASFVPNTFIYNKLDKEKVKDYIKRQKIAKEHLPNPWSILLIDDCMDDPKMFNDPIFQGLFKNGRHWKCLFILSLQYSLDVKPVIRTNIDGTFILRETNLRNRRALWENYAGVIPDFNDFCAIMDQITNDYTALYIHNQTTSNNLEDCLFWYKAKPVPKDFKLGSKDFWKFHSSRYNEDYVDPVV